MAEMRISIALCSWNGAIFLREQLASLTGQSRLPDELIVCDDGSTDETATVVERFASSSRFPVRLFRNPRRLGTVKNFEQAIAKCSGEVIFLCDQDDVWHREKVAAVSQAFEHDDETAAVFTNARQIDESGAVLERSLWDHIGFSPRERRFVSRGRALDVLAEHNVVTGATLAFRSRWRHAILPVPESAGMLHDQWIAIVLSAVAPIACIDDCLVDYRRHEAQQVGAGAAAGGVRRWVGAARETGPQEYAQHAAQLEAVLQRLKTIGASPARIDDLSRRIEHMRTRASLPKNRGARFATIMRELASLRYHRYSNHFWSAAKDLFW